MYSLSEDYIYVAMFTECLMVSQGQSSADRQIQAIKEQEHLASIQLAQAHFRYHKEIQSNPKFVHSELTYEAHKQNNSLKYQLTHKKVEIVLIPPLTAAIETYLDLLGEREDIEVYIEPLLQPRVNCAAHIPPTNLEEQLAKFRKVPNTAKIEQNPTWFMDLGASEWATQTATGRPQQYLLEWIQKHGDYESNQNFLDRNLRLRKQIYEYTKLNKKITLITHPSVLQTLTATGWHEDGKLINGIHFQFGQVKKEFVWIEGVEPEKMDRGFCGCG